LNHLSHSLWFAIIQWIFYLIFFLFEHESLIKGLWENKKIKNIFWGIFIHNFFSKQAK
jgi:hypothetical protein